EKLLDAACERALVGNFALPDDERLPARVLERGEIPRITIDVPLSLAAPELGVRCRRDRAEATGVDVPVAAVDEDYFAALAKDEIRPPRQYARVQAIAKPERVHEPPNAHLRLRVLGPDALHVFAALRGSVDVDHVAILRGGAASVRRCRGP